jgi:hypothetical protein
MRPTLLALAVIAAFAAQPARAANVCVGNGVELQAALSAAANSPEADVIRLRAGVYTRALASAPGTSPVFQLVTSQSGAIFISGGWNEACTARMANPLATVLHGNNMHPVLLISVLQQAAPNIVLHNLAIAGGSSTTNQHAALATFRIFSSGGAALDVTHLDFSGGAATSGNVVSMHLLSGKISFWNNLVHSSETTDSDIVRVNAAPGAYIELTNNTITENLAPQQGYAVNIDGGSNGGLYNNVIWGNPGGGNLRVASLTINASANHLGASSVPQGFAGTTTGDPMFTDVALGNYRPLPASPLRNSGMAEPPGGTPNVDLVGVPRSAGGRIDRGAYEFEELMSDGFE